MNKRFSIWRLAVFFCFCLYIFPVTAFSGDNGNATVSLGGLVVIKDAGCLGRMDWYSGMARAKSLAQGQCGLTDNSQAGDWRLPTSNELNMLYSNKSLFTNVSLGIYWSSSSIGAGKVAILMANASPFLTASESENYSVWPVRSGR